MTIKYFNPLATGDENMNNLVQAFQYAINNGAQVINYSGGGLEPSQLEMDLLWEAFVRNIIVVAAAGNEGVNSDIRNFFPADYDIPNIISVGSNDKDGQLVSSSNFGTETVDLTAPGKNILSTLPGGKFGTMSGTSQATAFVTGALVELLLINTKLNSAEETIAYLLKNSKKTTLLKNKTKSQARLDLEKLLKLEDPVSFLAQ